MGGQKDSVSIHLCSRVFTSRTRQRGKGIPDLILIIRPVMPHKNCCYKEKLQHILASHTVILFHNLLSNQTAAGKQIIPPVFLFSSLRVPLIFPFHPHVTIQTISEHTAGEISPLNQIMCKKKIASSPHVFSALSLSLASSSRFLTYRESPTPSPSHCYHPLILRLFWPADSDFASRLPSSLSTRLTRLCNRG